METLELWNDALQRTGIYKRREDVHRDGDVHAVVRVHILRIHQGNVQTLLQKRSMKCEAFPGFYDIACAGHIEKDDTPESTAVRELQEELGVYIKEEDVHFITCDYHDYSQGAYLDREYNFIYLVIQDIQDIHLQKEEVEQVEWVDAYELLNKLDDTLTKYCILHAEVKQVLQVYESF